MIYPTKKSRIQFQNQLRNSIDFQNRQITILGCGCMGRLLLYWCHAIFKGAQITIIDKQKKRLLFPKQFFKSVHTKQITITKKNYKNVLNFLQKGDILIDASYDIRTLDMFHFCNERQLLYINSAIESWSFQNETNPLHYSLYYRNNELIQKAKQICHPKTNFIVTMGCNPGNVSLWLKYGILHLAKQKHIPITSDFAQISEQLGIQTIHISEHDSQIIDTPRRQGEYCNTWSWDPASFFQEACGPIELSWGTHETKLPELPIHSPTSQNRTCIYPKMGIQNWLRSYTPETGMFYGMTIRHDENLTIGDYLAVRNSKNQITYQPSVYYVYKPTDACLESAREYIEQGGYDFGEHKRLLASEIVQGSDELGLSIFLKNGDVYWIGSLLTIEEARSYHPKWMHPFVNATNVQVLGGYLTGLFYLCDLWKMGVSQGLMFPEQIPLHYLSISLAFQGEFVFQKAKWQSEQLGNKFNSKVKQHNWQYNSFFMNK